MHILKEASFFKEVPLDFGHSLLVQSDVLPLSLRDAKFRFRLQPLEQEFRGFLGGLLRSAIQTYDCSRSGSRPVCIVVAVLRHRRRAVRLLPEVLAGQGPAARFDTFGADPVSR